MYTVAVLTSHRLTLIHTFTDSQIHISALSHIHVASGGHIFLLHPQEDEQVDERARKLVGD